jgi:putative transposase
MNLRASSGLQTYHVLFFLYLETRRVTLAASPDTSPNSGWYRWPAIAERWVRSIKTECLSKLILFSEASLRRATTQFLEHYHSERNPQGKANLLLFPAPGEHHASDLATIRCRERLGGLLKYYRRAA